jgi:acyl-CoA thioesterase
MSESAHTLAQRAADAMFESDACSHWLGFALEEVRPGYARMRMKVRPEFLNGLGICHGGLMFTLADSTFAFACNSHNVPAVAAGCSIEFLRPVEAGDTLVAEALEQILAGRHGIYDIRVTSSSGEVVALFRGKSTQLKGHIVAP